MGAAARLRNALPLINNAAKEWQFLLLLRFGIFASIELVEHGILCFMLHHYQVFQGEGRIRELSALRGVHPFEFILTQTPHIMRL